MLSNPRRRRSGLRYESFSDPRSQIRLLTLNAASGYRSSSISCTLYNYRFIRPLDQDAHPSEPTHPPYVALSYTWGPSEGPAEESQDEERSHTIRVNDQKLNIGNNLFQALVQLKKSLPSGWPQHLWVDAVCINQRDDAERSAQVQIMGEIFSLARGVVIWLGEGSHREVQSSVRYMLSIRDMVDQVRREAVDQDISGRRHWRYNVDVEARCRAAGWTLAEFSQSMRSSRLFHKRWWMRTWVVQEFALAKEICFLWGNTLLDLWAVRNVISFYTWQHQPPTWSSEDAMWSALRLMETREDIQTGEPVVESGWQRILLAPRTEMTGSCALLYLLYKTRRRRVSNPLDQIYSLAGLAQRYCGNRIPIIPDYRKAPAEIYAEVIQYVVSESQWLGFLIFAEKVEVAQAAGLSSFVPHFGSFRGTATPVWDSPMLDGMETVFGKLLAAPHDGVPQLQNRVLSCYGICLGTLTGVLNLRILTYNVADKPSTSQVTNFITSCENEYRYMATSSPRLEAIWKTCLEGAHQDSRVITTSHFSSWLLWSLLSSRCGTGTLAGIQDALNEDPLARLLIAENPEVVELTRTQDLSNLKISSQIFEVACRERFSSRRLFRTDNFHVGTCSTFAREGDLLWWLARCPFPMVLRKKDPEDPDSAYSLVGWAYVYGLYEGSVLDEVDKNWQEVRMV